MIIRVRWMKTVLILLFFMLTIFMLTANTALNSEDINKNPEESAKTVQLLNTDFFKQNINFLLPASHRGLTLGVGMMLTGILYFADSAKTGYGSADMNRGIFVLNTGIIITVVSSLLLKSSLDAVKERAHL